MNTEILGTPPPDIRSEWRRLNYLVQDVQGLNKVTSSHSHLVSVIVNDDGFVFDFSGLVQALAGKGIIL
ncbi:MAG: hypothetical protein QOE26_2762 [Verrucomicrobiota bacterium]|jgi:hypothetical protein